MGMLDGLEEYKAKVIINISKFYKYERQIIKFKDLLGLNAAS